MKQVIGVTGGIASGKSTVTNYLRQQDYPVIDADQLVHQLQKKGGKLYEVLVEHFGQEILGVDGELDRPKLSQLIFSQSELRQLSSRLQDDIIRQALAEERDRLLTVHDVVFMDIPLLFELGYESWFDQIWLVNVSADKQLERLMARNQLSQQQAKARIQSQMPLTEKRDLASHVIDNNGELSDTYKQVAQLLATLRN